MNCSKIGHSYEAWDSTNKFLTKFGKNGSPNSQTHGLIRNFPWLLISKDLQKVSFDCWEKTNEDFSVKQVCKSFTWVINLGTTFIQDEAFSNNTKPTNTLMQTSRFQVKFAIYLWAPWYNITCGAGTCVPPTKSTHLAIITCAKMSKIGQLRMTHSVGSQGL